MDTHAVAALLAERRRTGWGIRRLARRSPASPSTLYRTLQQPGLHRRVRLPQPPIVRYEAARPGQLVHLDTLQRFALKGGKPVYQYPVIDDHPRLAYALLAPRRGAATAVQALQEAQRTLGYRFEAVMTDNDVIFTWAARPDIWRDRWQHLVPPANAFGKGCAAMGLRHLLTRVRRPQTNGKVERLHIGGLTPNQPRDAYFTRKVLPTS